jgi:carboxypeptidase T
MWYNYVNPSGQEVCVIHFQWRQRAVILTICILSVLFISSICDANNLEDGTTTGRSPIRVEAVNTATIRFLETSGFDIASRGSDFVEIIARPADLEKLSEMGLPYHVIGRDLFSGTRNPEREGNMDPEYHTYQEMLAELTSLATTYPNICRLYDIGDCLSRHYTWDNYTYERDVYGLRISDNPDLDEPEPCIVYDGRHHAREPSTTELCLALANHFCAHYGSDPLISTIVNNSEIWIVPMINADGHQWVEDIDPWWRKTLYDSNTNHHVDEYEGIDPNRNYDWNWISGLPDDETYGGPAPFSATCVAAMQSLHSTHRPAINPSFHCYGEYLLYPFGDGSDPEPVVIDIAAEYAAMAGYDNLQSTTLNGSSKDWVYGALGAVSFTVEIGTSFIPTGSIMLQDVNTNLSAALWLARRLAGASIRGTVTDSLTGAPLEALIHIPEIMEVYAAGQLADIKTEATTGFYCRMRPESISTITLEVSCEGYIGETIQVQTGGPFPTTRDFELTPLGSELGIISGVVVNATSGGAPVPGAALDVLGGPTFITAQDGTYSGYVEPGSYQVVASHESFEPDTSGLIGIVIGQVTPLDFELTDIAPPVITGTTELVITDVTDSPYSVDTSISDFSDLIETSLYYRLDGGSFIETTLTQSLGDQFHGEIPAQPYHTVVSYYIQARDSGNLTSMDPPAAPMQLYTFEVQPIESIYFDDLESGAGEWSHDAVTIGFGDQWHLSEVQNHSPGGVASWKCGDSGALDYGALLDAGLESEPVTLGPGSILTLWHRIDAEASGAFPTTAYDGGLVEISIDGEPWALLMPVGGYSHTCRVGGTPGPFPEGTPLFSGTHDWQQIEFDLSEFSGDAQFRFRFGSDGATGGEGWYLDDIEVRGFSGISAVDPPNHPVTSQLRCTRLLCAPSPLIGTAGGTIAYALTRPAAVNITVFDLTGRQVRKIHLPASQLAGSVSWDGHDQHGRPLGSGIYLLRLDAAGKTLGRGKLILLD